MKIRNGFVSNSSSSSFVIKLDGKDIKNLINLVQAYSSCKSWEKSIFFVKHFFGFNNTLQTILKIDIDNLTKNINSEEKEITAWKAIDAPTLREHISELIRQHKSIIIRNNEELKKLKNILKKIEIHKDDDIIVILTQDLNWGDLIKENYTILYEEST